MSQERSQLDVLRQDIERLTSQLPQSNSKDEALAIAIKAAEASMEVLTLVTDKAEKERTSLRVEQLMSQAERIKRSADWKREIIGKSTISGPSTTTTREDCRSGAGKHKRLKEPFNSRSLTNAEKIIVLKGGFLNGVKFPEWTLAPAMNEFDRKDGEDMFLDETSELPLSDFQLDVFDDWKRPRDAFPPPAWRTDTDIGHGPIMVHDREFDLVQDAATDCSVVASLSAILARFKRGFPRILHNSLHPRDPQSQLPVLSANGKYVMRMNFNGCWRKVIIDDRIPTSMSSRVIHVVDRNNPGLLWPALLEKAYLKVRGGYDFPGSNSGTDIWVLSGWVPEQVFLQYDELEPQRFWKRISNAFSYGDVLITLGTGKMSSKTERALGLAGEHDYAVLNLCEVDGQCLMLVKNPWCQGTSWRGRFKGARTYRHPQSGTGAAEAETLLDGDNELEVVDSPRDLLNIDDQLSPGTFWMDLDNVMQHFESMYLNWNPGLFSFRQDIHFQWDLSEPPHARTTKPRGAYASLQNNPQFTMTIETSGTVWILLWRHFQNFVPENATPEEIESGRQHIDLIGHISLVAFAAVGWRMMLPERQHEKACFVDSPQTLLKLEGCKAGMPYTIVPLEQELAPNKQSFTMSAFSNSPLTLSPAPPKHPHQTALTAAWTKDSAGGNAQHATYCDNPQFSIRVAAKTKISILLESSNGELNVHVKLLHSNGSRVYRIRNKDIIVDSKDYRRGCCIADCDELPAGSYTIICSTFEPDQLGDFKLSIESSQPAQLALMAREGAGRVRTELAPATFARGQTRLVAPIVPQRLINVYALARHIGAHAHSRNSHSTGNGSARPHIRLSIRVIAHGISSGGGGSSGTDLDDGHVVLAASDSGEYAASSAGAVRTQQVDLGVQEILRRYGVAECWLVLDRMSAGADASDDRFAVELYADQPDAVACGAWRAGED